MKLSTKGRYASRIMVCLALRPDGPVPKREIAEAEGITPDYVEQILIKLKAAGLVKSHRGVQGGFSLARPPEEIALGDVIRATEGDVCLVDCLKDSCVRAVACPTRPVWERANEALIAVFDGVTVAKLAQDVREHSQEGVLNFDI